MRMQSIIHAIYPPQCVACDTLASDAYGLCGPCWRETLFIGGTICDTCGSPLPGDDFDEITKCDDCMTIARPWAQGRSVLRYGGNGRKLVLRLKHGDRTDLAVPMGRWLGHASAQLIRPDTVIVPVPLHWVRLVSRRYNQAAVLALALGRVLDLPVVPDALLRPRKTVQLKQQNRDARFAALAQSMTPNPRRLGRIAGRSVLLIDDVMTTGATMAAAAEACHTAGADHVNVLTLARAVKDD